MTIDRGAIGGSRSGMNERYARILLLLLLMLVLPACATRPGADTLNPTQVSGLEGKRVKVLVATDRALGEQHTYGSGRGSLRYEALTISIPPGHRPGKIEWSKARSRDPLESFVVVGRQQLDEQAFKNEVAARGGKGGPTAVFVHGYNYSLQEAVFRLAQLAADVDAPAPILFSWPSDAAVAGYIADRDAVTYARDDLTHVLKTLKMAQPGRKTLVMGHSLGGWLVMETLRQLRLQGRDDVIAGLEVGLAAPDIDVDVFRKQLEVVGPLDPPLTILVSADDGALGISRRLSGDRPRIGAADVTDTNLQAFAVRSNIRVVDISLAVASDPSKHDRFVYIAAAMGSGINKTEDAFGNLRQTGAFVFNAAGAAVGSPFTVVGSAIGGQ